MEVNGKEVVNYKLNSGFVDFFDKDGNKIGDENLYAVINYYINSKT